MSRTIEALVERHMRNWELARQQEPPAKMQSEPVRTFVTVSRAVGSGGADVARKLADELGWPLFDREILHYMGGDDAVRKRLYETMDERDVSFVEESLRTFTEAPFERNDYFRRLTETVLAIARKESAVFLGRATDLILPRGIGFRVRIVAAGADCVERYARRGSVDHDKAAKEIDQIEKERGEFVRSRFDRKVDAPGRFDMWLTIGVTTIDDAVALIKHAMRLRGMTD